MNFYAIAWTMGLFLIIYYQLIDWHSKSGSKQFYDLFSTKLMVHYYRYINMAFSRDEDQQDEKYENENIY